MLLADYIRSQAAWRKGKAEQHPDDERNARSARALLGLAEVVEAMEKTPGGADLIESIEDELSRRSGGVAMPGELVSREVSRYGFDTEAPEPAPFLGALLSAAHADVAQEALDRLVAFVTENAVLWADVLAGNRGMMRRAAKAKAAVEELAASTGLRVELGDVEITAKLLVSASDADGSGEHEFGYIASMAVDLSGPYDLRDVVADLLAGTDLRPESPSVD